MNLSTTPPPPFGDTEVKSVAANLPMWESIVMCGFCMQLLYNLALLYHSPVNRQTKENPLFSVDTEPEPFTQFTFLYIQLVIQYI